MFWLGLGLGVLAGAPVIIAVIGVRYMAEH